MLPGVNMDQVRQYNKTLKDYRDKASKVQAGIEFNEKELNRLCNELSQTLGVAVTPDNIEQIRDEYITKINNTLATGTDIINRIRSEESIIQESANAPTSAIPQAPTMGQIPQAPQAPMMGQAPQAPQMPNQDIFNNLGNIPPIFGNQQ